MTPSRVDQTDDFRCQPYHPEKPPSLLVSTLFTGDGPLRTPFQAMVARRASRGAKKDADGTRFSAARVEIRAGRRLRMLDPVRVT